MSVLNYELKPTWISNREAFKQKDRNILGGYNIKGVAKKPGVLDFMNIIAKNTLKSATTKYYRLYMTTVDPPIIVIRLDLFKI